MLCTHNTLEFQFWTILTHYLRSEDRWELPSAPDPLESRQLKFFHLLITRFPTCSVQGWCTVIGVHFSFLWTFSSFLSNSWAMPTCCVPMYTRKGGLAWFTDPLGSWGFEFEILKCGEGWMLLDARIGSCWEVPVPSSYWSLGAGMAIGIRNQSPLTSLFCKLNA